MSVDQFNIPPQNTDDQAYCQMLFENMLEGFALLQRIKDTGSQYGDYNITYANSSFKDISGFPQKQITDSTIRKIFPDSKELLTQALDEVYQSTDPASFELCNEDSDIILSISIFRLKSGLIGCIFRDISESKRFESMLHAERDSLANVLEGTNAGNWHWNVQSGELTVNDRWATITGYTLEELLPVSLESWKKITHPEDIPKAMDALDRIFRGESSYYDVEFRQRHKNGHWVWVNARGKITQWTDENKPLLMSGIHLDITDRKLAEQALRKSEENMRITLKSIGDAVIATDTSGRITQMNPVAEALTGWSANDAEGEMLTDIFRIINSQTRQDVKNPVDQVLKTGQTVALANHTLLIARDESEYQIADSGAAIRNINGDIIGVVLVFRDVTNEYALQEQLRQSQKMEAVGQLAGGIAHDFNNLLQAILGYGEIVLDEIPPHGSIRDSVEQMIKAGNQAKIMTSQLLSFSRRQVLEMTLLDLNEVIADLAKIIRRLISENITLDIRNTCSSNVVRADRGQLGQILTNLCINARDAMDDGGTITIETTCVKFTNDFCKLNIWAKPGQFALLSINDTGCGMDDKTMQHAFDPFFSTKEIGKGTGLGLATVYGLVQQHNGIIKIQSKVNKGTTVKIYLPVVECKPPSNKIIEPATPTGNETILLAEDDPMVCDVCTRILQKAGYIVLSATNGEEAVQLFMKNKNTINMAILDVVMPKLGGKQVYNCIKEINPNVCFLFASGYSLDAIHTNFILDKGISLIRKPYKSIELLKKMREVLDKK